MFILTHPLPSNAPKVLGHYLSIGKHFDLLRLDVWFLGLSIHQHVIGNQRLFLLPHPPLSLILLPLTNTPQVKKDIYTQITLSRSVASLWIVFTGRYGTHEPDLHTEARKPESEATVGQGAWFWFGSLYQMNW